MSNPSSATSPTIPYHRFWLHILQESFATSLTCYYKTRFASIMCDIPEHVYLSLLAPSMFSCWHSLIIPHSWYFSLVTYTIICCQHVLLHTQSVFGKHELSQTKSYGPLTYFMPNHLLSEWCVSYTSIEVCNHLLPSWICWRTNPATRTWTAEVLLSSFVWIFTLPCCGRIAWPLTIPNYFIWFSLPFTFTSLIHTS